MGSDEEYLDNLLKSMGSADSVNSVDSINFTDSINSADSAEGKEPEAAEESLADSLSGLEDLLNNLEVDETDNRLTDEVNDGGEVYNTDGSNASSSADNTDGSNESGNADNGRDSNEAKDSDILAELSSLDDLIGLGSTQPWETDTASEEPMADVDIFGEMQTEEASAEKPAPSLLSEEDLNGFADDAAVLDALSLFSTGEDDQAEKTQVTGGENEDLMSLLGSLSEDEDLQEINSLLQKSDNNELVAELPEADKPVKKEKKKGFFSKLFTSLTEEDEEKAPVDENQAIMNELEEEDKAAAKKKAKKDKKGNKGKKGNKKGAAEEEENAEDNGKKGKKAKQGKAKKPEKPKKKKELKPEPLVPEKPAKRISKKSILVVVLFAATIFAAIFVAIHLFSGMVQKKNARAAYEKQDYLTCYQEWYGMKLSEEEEIMFQHAKIVLKMGRRLSVYEDCMEDDRELEALDSLMHAVAEYGDMYGYAKECGAEAEIAALYGRVLKILEENYGLTQEAASVIAQCKSNVEYTRYLTALTEGQHITTEEGGEGIHLPKEELEDLLPEEGELKTPNFAD